MKNSTLPFPFAKAMDVLNQVLFLIILASFTNGKLETADLQKIASQLKVTHYDCGEMTENNLYALNQVSKCNIAPENLEVSRAKITMFTKHFRQINATVCRVKYQSEQWHCGFGDGSSMDAHHTGGITIDWTVTAHTLTAITSLFSSTHMVWTLPLETTLQLCSPYSPATTMVYWHGRSPKRFSSQSAINSTPRIRGLLPSHPPRRYPFVGQPENHYLPWWTSTSSRTARCSAKLETFF